MSFAARLHMTPVDTEIEVSHQTGLAQKTGVGMDHLYHMGIVLAKSKLSGTVGRH